MNRNLQQIEYHRQRALECIHEACPPWAEDILIECSQARYHLLMMGVSIDAMKKEWPHAATCGQKRISNWEHTENTSTAGECQTPGIVPNFLRPGFYRVTSTEES